MMVFLCPSEGSSQAAAEWEWRRCSMRRFLSRANTQSSVSGGQETGQLFIDECHKENSAKKCLRRRKNTDKSHFNEEPRQKMRPPVPRQLRFSAHWRFSKLCLNNAPGNNRLWWCRVQQWAMCNVYMFIIPTSSPLPAPPRWPCYTCFLSLTIIVRNSLGSVLRAVVGHSNSYSFL